IVESDPEWVVEKTRDVLLEFHKPFSWKVDLLVLPDAMPGEQLLSFTIRLQACDKNRCVRGQQSYEMPIPVGNAPAVPLTPELEARLKATKPEIKIVPVPAQYKTAPDTP